MKWNLSESRWTMSLNQIMKKKGDYPYARIIGEAREKFPLTTLIHGENSDMR